MTRKIIAALGWSALLFIKVAHAQGTCTYGKPIFSDDGKGNTVIVTPKTCTK